MKTKQRFSADFFCTPEGVVFKKERALFGKERTEIFRKDGGKCVICGDELELFGGRYRGFRGNKTPAAIDHIFPRCRGGQNNHENLRLLCFVCNGSKGAR